MVKKKYQRTRKVDRVSNQTMGLLKDLFTYTVDLITFVSGILQILQILEIL